MQKIEFENIIDYVKNKKCLYNDLEFKFHKTSSCNVVRYHSDKIPQPVIDALQKCGFQDIEGNSIFDGDSLLLLFCAMDDYINGILNTSNGKLTNYNEVKKDYLNYLFDKYKEDFCVTPYSYVKNNYNRHKKFFNGLRTFMNKNKGTLCYEKIVKSWDKINDYLDKTMQNAKMITEVKNNELNQLLSNFDFTSNPILSSKSVEEISTNDINIIGSSMYLGTVSEQDYDIMRYGSEFPEINTRGSMIKMKFDGEDSCISEVTTGFDFYKSEITLYDKETHDLKISVCHFVSAVEGDILAIQLNNTKDKISVTYNFTTGDFEKRVNCNLVFSSQELSKENFELLLNSVDYVIRYANNAFYKNKIPQK